MNEVTVSYVITVHHQMGQYIHCLGRSHQLCSDTPYHTYHMDQVMGTYIFTIRDDLDVRPEEIILLQA